MNMPVNTILQTHLYIERLYSEKWSLQVVYSLWFLSFASFQSDIHLHVSRPVFKLQTGHKYITQIAIFKVQRATTPNIDEPELWFLCSAPHLMMFYICVTFH